MKNLYQKSKGKVYPSPTSSPSASCTSKPNLDSVIKFLPPTILTLASILSLEDKEVLAYLISRSMKITNPFSFMEEKKNCKRPNTSTVKKHKSPIFECGCFECYTSYWFRWDSSVNRELIHQVIEAFEDHLTNTERSPSKRTRGKKRDKKFQQPKIVVNSVVDEIVPQVLELETFVVTTAPENEVFFPVLESDGCEEKLPEPEIVAGNVVEDVAEEEVVVEVLGGGNNHKGLVRKVMLDVIGLFNSRMLSVWSTNV
ncbi:hypothetical protein IFM89_031091 [Coptis chinensis]|uniref:Uncharacterized protein n=1 Tax=Coptis chinensis TaxID=261450 RepID=A0A835IVD7_9MAGN|nr:hypothetical protein IFM89_031091 [Coptis chinensis]